MNDKQSESKKNGGASHAEVPREVVDQIEIAESKKIPLGGAPTPYVDETTERVKVPGIGEMVTERKTGKRWFEKDGKKIELEATNAAPQLEDMKPKTKKIAGHYIEDENGVRFVPNDEKAMDTLDLAAAKKEADDEAKLSPLNKAVRDLQKQQQQDNERLQALATDKDKVDNLLGERQQMQQQMQQMANDLQQKDMALVALADVMAKLRNAPAR